MKLDLENIKELSQKMNEHKLQEIKIETDDSELILKKDLSIIQELTSIEKIDNIEYPIDSDMEEREDTTLQNTSLNKIISPMGGTFYRSNIENGPPLVKIGEKISIGDSLCIIEAMKMMNSVSSNLDGEIIKILPRDGEFVKKGDILFYLK